MNKIIKIAIILSIIAAVGIGAYFAYQFFFNQAPQAPGSGNGIIDEIAVSRPTALTDDSVLDYWVNFKTNEIYYISENGQIHKVLSDRNKETISSQLIGELNYIKPSADGSLILASLGYPRSPTFAVYDIGSRAWQSLPAGITAADWDPSSNNRLAYLINNGSVSRLLLLTLDNQRTSEVLRLAQQDLDLDWVSADIIYFKERPSRFATGSLREFNLKTRILKTLISDEPGLLIKWSTGRNMGIKWSNDLSIVDTNGRIIASTNLKTIPSKCVFFGPGIYCAASSDQSTVSSREFPDDYLKKGLVTRDDLYLLLIDDVSPLAAIKDITLSYGQNPIDADRLELLGGQLLFINRYDKNIYSLEL
ncbi:MAG: hypothetical protein HYT03_00305 [Candidatus Harrisonbacteria bacterium]|nr:hypothetical protein [Candidatus Harrisonbacteria bacterium]